MRLNVCAAILALFWTHAPVLAEDTRRSAIVDIIGAQLEAFQRDDAAAAFAFASPDIQAMFGTAENFIRMVAEAYTPVYRPRATTFLDLVEHKGRTTQRVLFTGPDGKQVVALYMMARQADGTWRIAGCVLIDPIGKSA